MILALLFWLARILIEGSLLGLVFKVRGTMRLLFLSLPLGMAVTSCFYFFWLLFHGPGGPFILMDIPFIAGSVIYLKYNRSTLSVNERLPETKTQAERLVRLLFIPAATIAVLIFVFLSIREPYGQWDAWATWNLRARYLFRSNEHWKETFVRSVVSTNPDYPLLIPATIAQGWHLAGKETQLVPVLVGFLFALATAGLLYTFLKMIRGSLQAQLASLLLICSPFFLDQSTAQFADIPIGCFYLLTTIFLLLPNFAPENARACFLMAGLSAGFAAWTKNEGFLFIISVLITCALSWILRRKERFVENPGLVLLGSLPGIITTILFKVLVGSPGYLLSKGASAWIEGLKDPARWMWVTRQFFGHGLQIGEYKLWLPVIFVLYACLVGIRKDHLKKVAVPLASILVCLCGYLLFYLVTPLAYGWQIRTSLDRLFLQVLPSLLFLFFVLMKMPVEKESLALGH